MPTSNGSDTVHESLVRVARRTLVVVAIVVLALLLWRIRAALLLGFIGILLAVLYRGLASIINRYTRIPISWALLLIAIVLLGLAFLFFWFAAGPINEQFSQLSRTLPESIHRIKEAIARFTLGKYLLNYLQSAAPGTTGGVSLFSGVTGIAATIYNVITDLLLVVVSAIYFAVNPQIYKRGILLLIPKSKAQRIGEVLDASAHTLGYWLLGQVILMLFVGVMVTIGMSIIGTPLALVLGLISGVLEFVPIFGPLAAAVPGLLIAMTLGWAQVLYTGLVYLIVQETESNVLVPLIQKVTVEVPPALVVLAIVAFASLFGILGIFVATPLTALALVWVRMLYVEDALGKTTDLP